MPTVTIDGLPAVAALAADDLIPIHDTSTSITKSATAQQVIDLVAPNMVDSTFRIVGSSDSSKKIALEVDGLTTATTRTITPPDRDLLLGITLGTQQASTSGTSIDFTGIPAGIRRITVMLNGVSTNGTSNIIIQIGVSAGIEATGYNGSAATDAGAANFTTGFGICGTIGVGSTLYGAYTLTLMNSSTNTWVGAGVIGHSDATDLSYGAGRKALAAVLDRVRITMVNGTDAFDAGAINIAYE